MYLYNQLLTTMNFLKIITILNWIVIAILAVLVAAETIWPAKGGDAAGRGMGQAFYYLAIIALFVLLGLNLLPYNWAKYTTFALIVAPVVLLKLGSGWSSLKRGMAARIEEAKPIFEDKERDRIARAIYDGEPETLKKLLQTPVARLNENGELLAYAVGETAGSAYKSEERLECIRLLFQAGARLDSANASLDVPIHIAVADVGNAALLRLLLEQGADANARYHYFKRAVLFEALGSHQQPDATVRVLLEFGADPNATAVYDEEQGPITPLFRAAELGRWGLCATLLEKGANPDVKAADGTSFQTLFQEAEKNFSPDGYTTREDFERLKKEKLRVSASPR